MIIKQSYIATLCFFIVSQSYAVVLSYYRFEVDLNADPLLLESPNEISGEPAITAVSARIDDTASSGSLPNLFIPLNGLPNTASLDGIGPDASGNPDIDARAAYTSTLNVDEFTAELFVRTEESNGVLISRSSTENVLSSIADGFRIYDPQALKVDFYTSDGLGGGTLHTITTSVGLDDISPTAGFAAWRHLAFSFEQSTGTATLYLDGIILSTLETGAGSTAYWGADPELSQPELQLGVALDGFNFSKTETDNGYIDEVRISSTALTPSELLNVPEPSAYALIVGFIALTITQRRRR